MTDAERRAMIERRMAEERVESEGQTRVFYLSFAERERWLGGCWVRAVGPISAMRRTHELGINPGGQVLIVDVPESAGPDELPPADKYDKLLGLDEIKKLMAVMSWADWEKERLHTKR